MRWFYLLKDWLKERPRRIKWWFIRANGHVPSCDCWEFNCTIAQIIEEGLSWMLYHGTSATWLTEGSELKQRSDLIFVKDTMANFQEYYLEMEYDRGTFEKIF